MTKTFQTLILQWGQNNKISYPWRENPVPYKVLISEFFLSRTRAHQVIPVYNSFLEVYPTLDSFLNLQAEIIEEQMKPLGLQKKVEQLETLARQIRDDFNKKLPENFVDLKSLKGIGKYIANAIMCFGFNQKRPLLDVNFIRIYKRVFKIVAKTKTAKTDKFLWEFSESLLPNKNYVDFNYAIIDLGIDVCKNSKPNCSSCPLTKICFNYITKSDKELLYSDWITF